MYSTLLLASVKIVTDSTYPSSNPLSAVLKRYRIHYPTKFFKPSSPMQKVLSKFTSISLDFLFNARVLINIKQKSTAHLKNIVSELYICTVGAMCIVHSYLRFFHLLLHIFKFLSTVIFILTNSLA
jgi:hypothetical protein